LSPGGYGCGCGEKTGLATKSLDVLGHGYGLDAVWVVGVAAAKSAGFGAFAQQHVAALDGVLVHEYLASPLFNCDEASIHFKKLGKKTIPAGSQSPNITCTS